ncbi:MAG: glycosyltransferase family 39 protein [Polyangiales bacterium]
MTSSPASKRASALRLGAVLAAVAALLFVRLGGFGIWDPWELDAADAARALLEGEGEAPTDPPLARWMVARSFAVFGVSEGAGRLPLALGGLAAALACALMLWRFAGERAAAIGALVVASTPLLLFNARQMHGDSLAMAGSALVFFCAASLAFRPSPTRETNPKQLGGWLAGLVAAWAVAVLAGGAMQAVVPPLGAVALVVVLRGLPKERLHRLGAAIVVGLGVVITIAVGSAIAADEAGYSALIGGAPRGGNPPTFEAALEIVFHGLAPWTALLFVAGVRLLVPRADENDAERARTDLRYALLFWAALGYGSLVLHTARYGPATYLPVVALAAAIALFLDEVQESGRAWWPEAVVGVLLTGLVLRDFVLYPESPMRGMALDGLSVPEVFDRKHEKVVVLWAAALGLFGLAVGLVLGSGKPDEDVQRPDWREPLHFLRDRWAARGAARAWLVIGGVLLVGVTVFGLVCLVGGDALQDYVVSIVVRVGKKLVFLPVLIAVAVWATPWVFFGMRRLGRFRVAPLVAAGVLVGAYSAFVFHPALSAHFSPREVYDTYNELRAEGDELAEYRVSGRAAAYYAEGETTDVRSQDDLLSWLGEESRRWAVIPADELASVNRAFRQRAGRHLFVADARSARVLLVTNRDVEGRENENFIANAVFSAEDAPAPQHRVNGRFDERIELVGYDLDLPQRGYVGAGQSFTVTWHWKALQRVPGSYKIFLHVDGAGNRLNGDHDAVEERYPVRLWDEGDVVLDRQTLTVPANYRPGSYTFFIGFYAGNDRLGITPADLDDGEKRMRAGTLIIR